MEPRARAGRHKSGLNFGEDLRQVLVAYGAPTHPDLASTSAYPDSDRYLNTINATTPNTSHRPTPYQDAHRFPNPYPETLRVLDEILTDFIIETCHGAVKHAGLAGRQKVNGNDFEWVIRRDKYKMGRVQDLLRRNKALKEDRKLVDGNEGAKGGKMDEGLMAALGGLAGEDSGTGKGKGRGRGRRRKRAEMEDVGEGLGGQDGEDAGFGGSGQVGEDGLLGDVDADGEAEDDEDDGRRPPKRARSDTG